MNAWKGYFTELADYQHWACEVLLTSLDHLEEDVIDSDQGLYFTSIHHTLDHILVVSQVWLGRLQGENLAVNYRVINHPDWRELKQSLRRETRRLQAWLEAQPDAFYTGAASFAGSDGKPRSMTVVDALTHLFTHYAHHRGQISAVITRLRGPCPEMDFVYYRREREKLLSGMKEG
jgi:uncharacterized damage-inducible protein DinB